MVEFEDGGPFVSLADGYDMTKLGDDYVALPKEGSKVYIQYI